VCISLINYLVQRGSLSSLDALLYLQSRGKGFLDHRSIHDFNIMATFCVNSSTLLDFLRHCVPLLQLVTKRCEKKEMPLSPWCLSVGSILFNKLVLKRELWLYLKEDNSDVSLCLKELEKILSYFGNLEDLMFKYYDKQTVEDMPLILQRLVFFNFVAFFYSEPLAVDNYIRETQALYYSLRVKGKSLSKVPLFAFILRLSQRKFREAEHLTHECGSSSTALLHKAMDSADHDSSLKPQDALFAFPGHLPSNDSWVYIREKTKELFMQISDTAFL